MDSGRRSTPQPETPTTARRSWQRWVIAGTVILGVIVLGVWGVAGYRYRMAIAYQMPTLSGAVYFYHQQYGMLPPSLQAVRDTGAYGLGATRLPRNRWEGWNEHTGPDVLYLPAVDWDGKSEYVIAVQPPIESLPRGYLVCCEGVPDLRSCTEEELANALARDDELRAATSQPGRWRDMPWQNPATGAR